MIYAEEKQRFFQELIRNGVSREGFVPTSVSANVAVPPELIAKWKKRWFNGNLAKGFELPEEPRLVNHFCIGADPEFILANAVADPFNPLAAPAYGYMHAEKLGLSTTDAFGCDMSGRQAELRAYPSRFVLEVVASLIDTVRWMNEHCQLSALKWLAPASFNQDGCGGHVHFGRKNGSIKKSVASLDKLAECLLSCSVLDVKGQLQRIENGRMSRYGANGDYRVQTHGYEYRTLPTWMSSPLTAYLTLTLSKLAVLEDLTALKTKNYERVIWNLLRAYQGRDDDARIALIALEKYGMPKYSPDDFKARWGIPQHGIVLRDTDARHRYFYPPVIEPDRQTVKELFEHFVKGTKLPARLPEPSWKLWKLPKELNRPEQDPHRFGLPDVISGLLAKECDVHFSMGGVGLLPDASSALTVLDGVGLSAGKIAKAIKEIEHVSDIPVRIVKGMYRKPTLEISVPRHLYDQNRHAIDKNAIRGLRSLFTDTGLFPLLKWTNPDIKFTPVAAPQQEAVKLGRIVSRVNGGYNRA